MYSHFTAPQVEIALPTEIASPDAFSTETLKHCWAIVLAGGDGTRLQSLTFRIAGDLRPKQFCSILGEQSLLAQTRSRVDSLIDADRQLFVVTRAHETFYREELRDVDDSNIIVQPINRGTGVAIALAILQILQRDRDAMVVLVPSDHYYSNVEALGRTIRSAVCGAGEYQDALVLLGSRADYAEIEYGWIEPGRMLTNASAPLLRVNRFWEKPSLQEARELLRTGCLWNTFVTTGYAETFLNLLCSEVPNLILYLNQAPAEGGIDAAFQKLPAVDFSRAVLSRQSHRLLSVRDTDSGWTDLGSPARVYDVLTRNKLQPVWWRDRRSVEANLLRGRRQ